MLGFEPWTRHGSQYEAHDIPMCHCASVVHQALSLSSTASCSKEKVCTFAPLHLSNLKFYRETLTVTDEKSLKYFFRRICSLHCWRITLYRTIFNRWRMSKNIDLSTRICRSNNLHCGWKHYWLWINSKQNLLPIQHF